MNKSTLPAGVLNVSPINFKHYKAKYQVQGKEKIELQSA